MSTKTTTYQAQRIGPALRQLRRNVEAAQPRVDWRAPRFASVTESSNLEVDELIDLTHLF